MLSSVLALATVGATLGVHVVEIRDLPLLRANELAHALASELQALSGDRVIADGDLWGECADERACARELALRDGTRGVILLRLFATPNVVLVTASRFREDGAPVLVASRRLIAETNWRDELASLARELEPDRAVIAAATAAPPVPADHPPWLWIGAGVGSALAATALIFSLTSWSARRELLDGASGRERVVELTDRMEDHALIANLCLSAAIVAALAGVVGEALEPAE